MDPGRLLRGLVWRIAVRLPEGLARRLLRGRAWSPAELTVAIPPSTPVRLFIAPTNSAGQGWAWARAVERELVGVGAFTMAIRTPGSDAFAFEADQRIPETAFVFARGWRRQQHDALVDGFTHVLLESGRFCYGNLPGTTPRDAAVALAREGLRIALLWHGSDIRLPSAHVAEDPDSPFRLGGGYPPRQTAVLERNVRANLEFIRTTDFPVFVSTPDLLQHAPRAVWLPGVVDVDRWAAAATSPPMQRGRPVVVHAPSNGGLKGTEAIRPIMRALDAEGLVDYRELSGVPSSRMPAAYGEADIVLDQFSLGIYGVAADEALAAGRILISHVGEFTRRTVREQTGLDLPIIEARVDRLEEVIRGIVAAPGDAVQLASTGPDYVRKVHDGRRSARVLAEFLGASVKVQGLA